MMSTTEIPKCPKCGTPLPKDAPHGLCPRCLGALNFETQTVLPDEGAPGVPPLSPADLAPLFPQLDILELLGKGGMGAVYKARQKQLDRIVALKILPPGVGKDKAFAERFAREARALARLNHPGIVTLYEFGQTAIPEKSPTSSQPGASDSNTPLYFFLMEFVDGVNLRELLRAGRISPREALAIVPQICDALQFAHDQGIIHRDIKPENILVDRRSRVKIADFGIAKLIGTEDEDTKDPSRASASLTSVGQTIGTPSYMAPEQREQPETVDHRADIYALGVVFYEMLTGELPGQRLAPPSTKVRIDVRLDEIVLHAMEKAPERRYQHASQVKSDVNTVAETGSPPPRYPAPERGPVGLRQEPARSTSPGWNLAGYAVAAAVGFVLLLLVLSVGAIVASIILPGIKSAFRGRVVPGREMAVVPLGPASQHQPQVQKSSPFKTAGEPSVGLWAKKEDAPIRGRGGACAVWTGEEMIVFGGEGMNVSFGDGAIYNAGSQQWRKLPQEGAAPSARTTFSAVWTGEGMIIWGGFGGSYGQNIVHNDGAQYLPEINAWVPVTTRNAPEPRFNHVAVWTGKEMVVWGGYNDSHSWYAGGRKPGHLNSGGRYDPKANSWRSTTLNHAPSPRFNHVAVWTGNEMIVWGGGNASDGLSDGGCYDPVEDAWRPISNKGAPAPRCMPMAVWTGEEMIVWGGGDRNETKYLEDGARYNPSSDSWKPMSTKDAPVGRIFCQAMWTGRYMLFWGGVNDAQAASTADPRRYMDSGAIYDPQTDSWTAVSIQGAPSPRLTLAVWTGDSMLAFGGYNNIHLNDLFELKL